jgi:hypothetical protein
MKISRVVLGILLGLVVLLAACDDNPPPDDGPTVTSVSISSKPSSMKVGDPAVTLTAIVQGDNNPAQTVTWVSSDASVASLSSTGELRALKVGTTVISATSTIDNSKKDTFTLSVIPTSDSGGLKINPANANTTVGGSPILLLALKPSSSDVVNWSFDGTPLGNLSATTGDSVTYTPPASGAGTAIIKASTGLQEARVTITITSTPVDASRIYGIIEDWSKTSPVLFTATTNQYETVANERVGVDGEIDMTLNIPKDLADLDGSFDVDICSADNDLRSEPAILEGAILYDIAGLDEGNGESLFLTQRSFVAGTAPLDGDGFIFRVYSASAGTITGSCDNPGSGFRLEFDLDLTSGWNLVEATYNQGNREFSVQTASRVDASMKLEAESYDSPATNIAPYANLAAYVGPGLNEVIVDASLSYDPDGYISYWSLDMGDGVVLTSDVYGDISNMNYYSYIYASSGLYTITLTVYDDDGDSATATAVGNAY